MTRRAVVQRERTLEMARAFLAEVRRDLEKATAAGCDLPPRLRSVHVRAGHATPEYRTLAIPTTPGNDPSPEILSDLIARYATVRPPSCMLLALDGLSADENGQPRPILIAEARDASGNRAFWMQPFRALEGKIVWEEAFAGGWQDPEDQELILDLAFAGSEAEPSLFPLPVAQPAAEAPLAS